jgi:hypothetical protein
VAVVLTPVETKEIGINVHKLNNTKTPYKQYKTVNTSTYITKTPHITKPIHTHTNT